MPLLGRTTRIRNIHKGKFPESISGNVESRQSTQNEKTRQKAGFLKGSTDVTGGQWNKRWCPKPESNRHALTSGGF